MEIVSSSAKFQLIVIAACMPLVVHWGKREETVTPLNCLSFIQCGSSLNESHCPLKAFYTKPVLFCSPQFCRDQFCACEIYFTQASVCMKTLALRVLKNWSIFPQCSYCPLFISSQQVKHKTRLIAFVTNKCTTHSSNQTKEAHHY